MLYPGFSYRTNRTMHRIIEVIYHFAPAYVFDMILRVQGAKPIMAKIAKRFQMAADTGWTLKINLKFLIYLINLFF